MSRRGWMLFAVMAVIWGIPYLLIKVAVGTLNPVVLVFARTAIAALVLLPIAARQGALAPVLRQWRPVLLFAVVEIAAPWLLLTDAERHVPSSLAGLLVAVVPLIGAMFAWLSRDNDRIDVARLGGLLVGLLGVATLFGLDVRVGHGELRGAVEVLLTAVGYAIGPMIVARRLSDVPSIGVTASALGLTALAYAPFAIPTLPHRMPPATVVASVVVLALLCTAVAFLVFFPLIAEVGPARATVITYVNPAIAIALGVWFLDEPFTLGTAVGFPLVLLGSWFGTRGRRRRAVPQPAAQVTDSSCRQPAG